MAFENCWRIIAIDCRHIFQTAIIALTHHVRQVTQVETQVTNTIIEYYVGNAFSSYKSSMGWVGILQNLLQLHSFQSGRLLRKVFVWSTIWGQKHAALKARKLDATHQTSRARLILFNSEPISDAHICKATRIWGTQIVIRAYFNL